MENPATRSDLYKVIYFALAVSENRDPSVCGLSDTAMVEQAILKKFIVTPKPDVAETD